jgi:hypothetical protein
MRYKLLISLLLLSFWPVLKSQVPEFNRTITKTYHVSSGMSVEISNKYGKIQIIPWNQDSVKFSIDMRIRAKDLAKLEKMKQNVEFEFVPGSFFLTARTKFNDAGSEVFKDLVDIAGSYLSPSNSVTINYTVMVPDYLTLKVENRFGDVYLEDHAGAFNLVLSYGNFKANRLSGRSEMKLTSGDADINYIKDGTMTVSYANMHIRESSRLVLQSQSSVITIEKIGTIKLNSRRDKLYLNDLNYISGDTYFSVVNIGAINNNISLNSRYGDIIAEDIRRSFSLVNISSELTDVSLAFERPLVFSFDMTHHQLVNFIYPKTVARLSTKLENADDKIFSTTGNFGTGTGDSQVIIKALRKSNITVSQR